MRERERERESESDEGGGLEWRGERATDFYQVETSSESHLVLYFKGFGSARLAAT
jgi:hypothetical protein